MERFVPLLLDAWREVGQHTAMEEALARIVPLLARRLPVERVLIRELIREGPAIETLAQADAWGQMLRSAHVEEAEDGDTAARSGCSQASFEAILTRCLSGAVWQAEAEAMSRTLPGLLPAGLHGTVAAGALTKGEDLPAVLILVARPGEVFTVDHEPMVQALLEPFSVALQNHRRLRELTRLREAAEADRESLLSRLGRQDIVDSVVGAETGLKQVMERVALVARSDVPVLILGETGSGKEVAARAIHSQSKRIAGPFLRVNCGALPSELIDSELFGHERGSFTGATNLRKGWFERADGGTLFLDEFAELPLAAQVRLLRILQDGTFERVGGQRQHRVDVRVVAATNRDVKARISQGLFREDLWYRIAVFAIHIPPLRDRPEDIPALAAHFALRAAKRLGTTPLVPAPADNTLLLTYPWPGNVRELAAVMERAAILGDGRRLDIAKALGSDAYEIAPAPPLPQPVGTAARITRDNGLGSRRTATSEPICPLDQAIIEHIERALSLTGGRVEGPYGAAGILEVNPQTLRSKMRRLGIDPRPFRRRSGERRSDDDRKQPSP